MRRLLLFSRHAVCLLLASLLLCGLLSACGQSQGQAKLPERSEAQTESETQDPNKLPYADVMEQAAELHSKAAGLIREERLSRGIPLSEDDKLGIGLLGEEFTAIMTTSAGLPEKRTSQLPDFAALCVHLFNQAGLKAGDAVGANFSGSYPGLNLAVLCAAEVMGLDLRYTTSVGSSAYGANVPQYTFPEMVKTVCDAGLISRMPILVTLGGGGDMGRNYIGYVIEDPDDIALIEEMIDRLKANGLVPAEIESYTQDISLHEELYGDIRLFVNVGGNGLGLGGSEDSYMLKAGNGLLQPREIQITGRSGLTERYLAKGIPAVHLLAVGQLCEDNGIPFDPDEIPAPGTSDVYFRREKP